MMSVSVNVNRYDCFDYVYRTAGPFAIMLLYVCGACSYSKAADKWTPFKSVKSDSVSWCSFFFFSAEPLFADHSSKWPDPCFFCVCVVCFEPERVLVSACSCLIWFYVQSKLFIHKQANLWVSITVTAFISCVRDCKRDKEGDIRRSLVLKPINHDVYIEGEGLWPYSLNMYERVLTFMCLKSFWYGVHTKTCHKTRMGKVAHTWTNALYRWFWGFVIHLCILDWAILYIISQSS